MRYDFLLVAIDDATRFAYVEVLTDERRQLTTGFLIRTLRWYRERGIRVEPVMTDNSAGYIARPFRNRNVRSRSRQSMAPSLVGSAPMTMFPLVSRSISN